MAVNFIKPPLVGLEEYSKMKLYFKENTHASISYVDESFIDYFTGYFNWLLISFIGGIVLISISILFEQSIIFLIFMLPGLLLLIAAARLFIQFITDIPSYFEYKEKKKKYYDGLKKAIVESSSYEEFKVKYFFL
ncbi:MAG: hypothetical protein IPM47_03645 [Sphingobacteriales bacterium]|nr:MAG: hypothetical protein IPM47_03645 [Sphingobacteriales bacterium]